MKKIIFYCTLILSGSIGLSNLLIKAGAADATDALYLFMIFCVIFIVVGLIGAAIEIKRID
jgi:hypothetical protein